MLPSEEVTSEQIEDIMSAISEMGVNIVESDEDAIDPDEKDVDELGDDDGQPDRPVIEKKKETIERTDDPVRMYLREMGSVELLSREGEIAIAKRIEAGREAMIAGLGAMAYACGTSIDVVAARNLAKLADGKSVRYLNINNRLADANGRLFDGVTVARI